MRSPKRRLDSGGPLLLLRYESFGCDESFPSKRGLKNWCIFNQSLYLFWRGGWARKENDRNDRNHGPSSLCCTETRTRNWMPLNVAKIYAIWNAVQFCMIRSDETAIGQDECDDQHSSAFTLENNQKSLQLFCLTLSLFLSAFYLCTSLPFLSDAVTSDAQSLCDWPTLFIPLIYC